MKYTQLKDVFFLIQKKVFCIDGWLFASMDGGFNNNTIEDQIPWKTSSSTKQRLRMKDKSLSLKICHSPFFSESVSVESYG